MRKLCVLMALLVLILAGCGGPDVPETTPAASISSSSN